MSVRGEQDQRLKGATTVCGNPVVTEQRRLRAGAQAAFPRAAPGLLLAIEDSA